jgi:hypothetical protein
MLPVELLYLVASQSDYAYQTLIILSMLSKFLRQKVDPIAADYDSKVSFVLKAEQNFVKHRPSFHPPSIEQEDPEDSIHGPGNFGCYYCFRVLDAENFMRDTPAHDDGVLQTSRRKCNECQVRTNSLLSSFEHPLPPRDLRTTDKRTTMETVHGTNNLRCNDDAWEQLRPHIPSLYTEYPFNKVQEIMIKKYRVKAW